MELVEGPTLADRIAQGRIPVEEALPIARQIAEALEAAHAQGIIHRDLKPANIKVTAEGTVKVLDFGLAKALDAVGAAAADSTISPSPSPHLTQAGVILGTTAYMSPEQARGNAVDARTDVWSFGCVLFEMLTARRAFKGDDVTDTIVAVMSREPDWGAFPPAAASIRPLIAWCLKKDVRARLQSIGDARIQIDHLIAGRSLHGEEQRPAAQPSSRWPLPVATVVSAGLIAAVGLWTLKAPAQSPLPLPMRFEVVSTPAPSLVTQSAVRNIAISPDGRHIVYRTGIGTAGADPAGTGPGQLIVRAIDRLDARPLARIADPQQPFISPDSQWIGFFGDAGLQKVAITGGSAVTICQIQGGGPRGAAWDDDDSIVFATIASGILRVSANGGTPARLTGPDQAKGERNHLDPSLLPGGRGVLFTIIPTDTTAPPQVAVLDLKGGLQKTLILNGSQAQ